MPFTIGLLGAGIVGGGVCILGEKLNNFKIKKVCVKERLKARDFNFPHDCLIVDDYLDIINDPEIDCLVEVMGGVEMARDAVFAAIRRGKHVVTANKALIAKYMPELLAALKENPDVKFGFEASVCGGIPIIHTLQSTYFSDNISSISGIMNGTTNYILSQMGSHGMSFDEALKLAQEKGFAEANPHDDVEGIDIQSKIAILTKLAFGSTVVSSSIPTCGITSISANDFEILKCHGLSIRMIGSSVLTSSGLSIFVSPMIVEQNGPFGRNEGASNLVEIVSENLGKSVMSGPGAGRFPTANSIVNDLVRFSLNKELPSFLKDRSYPIDPELKHCFYFRMSGSTKELDEVLRRPYFAPILENMESQWTHNNQQMVIINTKLMSHTVVNNTVKIIEEEVDMSIVVFAIPYY